jgi:asparagine synthase (glutamine-hydrolysing)
LTALAAVFSRAPGAAELPAAVVSTPALTVRGAGTSERWSGAHAFLFVGSFEWEGEPNERSGLIAHHDGVAVIADASLYHRDALRRKLAAAGMEPRSNGAAELIRCAYAVWSDDCARHLEGDFSFLIWDGIKNRAVLGRDFVGRRPLFYALSRAGDLVVASSARAIANHPDLIAPLDRVTIAAALGGLFGASLHTGFEGISALLAGATYAWSPTTGLRLVREWDAPVFAFGATEDVASAAADLRELLIEATATRLVPATSVWLSGGADSTAVFGAAHAAIEDGRAAAAVRAISVSYPGGDSAREDDFISATAGRWKAPVAWIDSETVPLLDEVEYRAGLRDDPYAHTFEQLNRMLARRTVAEGSRVALDGYGGDQLFNVSAAFLADLALHLRLRVLARSLAAMEIRDARAMIRLCLVPILPEKARALLARLRGREGLRSSLEQTLPSWLRPEIASDARLRARASPEPSRRLLEGPAAHESRWYITSPFFPRAAGWTASFALQEGVEVRSPLMDERVVRFAASRPLLERAPLGGGKRVLRSAVTGLVPDTVLAPRPKKTGVPRGYFHRRLADEFAPVFREVFSSGSDGCRLADLELIELSKLRAAYEQYLESRDHILGVNLYLTLQAEAWLRSQQRT